MVLVQQWPFFQFFFLGNIGQKNVFYDILQQKNAFLRYKNRKFKKSKNGHFSYFFLRQYRPGKCHLRYSKTKKTPFCALKTRSSKSRKNDLFLKGLAHGFGPNMAIFPTFFFRQYRPEKCLLRYYKTKKRLSRL